MRPSAAAPSPVVTRPLVLALSLGVVAALLTACGGGYVDSGSGGGFVDSTPQGGFDRETATGTPILFPEDASSDITVRNSSSDGFVPPPRTENQVQGPEPRYEESFVGKNAVEIWAWNVRGSQKAFLPEGARLPIDRLGIIIEVATIATGVDGNEAVLVIDGERIPALGEGEQVRVRGTYITVTRVFVRDATS